jgi:hypothetical protein
MQWHRKTYNTSSDYLQKATGIDHMKACSAMAQKNLQHFLRLPSKGHRYRSLKGCSFL